MPVKGMDGEKKAHADKGNADGTEIKISHRNLSPVSNTPDALRYDGIYSTATTYREHSRPISRNKYDSQLPSKLSSPTIKSRRVVRSSSPYESSSEKVFERPEKRPRLETKHDDLARDGVDCGEATSTDPQHDNSPPVTPSRLSLSPRRSEISDHISQIRCSNCIGGAEVADNIIESLSALQKELAKLIRLEKIKGANYEIAEEITKHDLKHTLNWIDQEIRLTTRSIQNTLGASKTGLPSLAEVVPSPHADKLRNLSATNQSSLFVATAANLPGRLSAMSDPSRSEDYYRRSEDSNRDHILPPIIPPDEMKRIQTHEQWSAQSSHPSSGSSMYGSAFSPMQSQPSSRALPSPPSSQYPSNFATGSSTFSPTSNQAAHASHLQDLQHQISTKTLALQTLQREHDQLLAAFSRSQIRCNTLDKKAKVSDHEINTLTEEKIRLQHQVESLEAQVENLMKSRDDALQQSSADGAQWRQIMAMSSQLQLKGADEARRFKESRDSWEQERAALENRIQELELGQPTSVLQSRTTDSRPVDAGDDVLNSSSVDALKQEVIHLRRRCTELELMMQEITGDTEQIDSAIAAMSKLRQRIAGKKSVEQG